MADSNKTEKATPQRRKKAREQGQIARSRDLPGVLALMGVAGTAVLLADGMAEHWRSLYGSALASAASDELSANGPLLFWCSVEVLRWIGPCLLVALLLSVGAGLAQGGLNIAPEALSPKFDRFNPVSRLKQIVSLTSLSTMGKSLLPFTVILVLGAQTMRGQWGNLMRASETDVHALASVVAGIALSIGWKSVLVLLAWSAVDFGLTWRKNESDLRMSKEEIKQEMKSSDGNPAIKGRIRKLQRTMRKRHSLKAVATATIVVTNPTHFAVALKYEPAMSAPQVVAKGADLLARKIKQLARDHDVMVMENKPLAQALYKSVEVGDAIPAELYQAVAEILVIVFRAQADLREQDQMRRSRNAAGDHNANRDIEGRR